MVHSPTIITLLIPCSINRTVEFLEALRATFKSLSTLNVPTISAVAGQAYGGGFELALATHLRIFSTTALVSLPETRLGIIPGAGGTYRLRSIIGESRALEMILTGRKLNGTDAYSWGLCERIVRAPPGKSWDRLIQQRLPDESDQRKEERLEIARESRVAVLDEAIKFAEAICEGGPLAIEAALSAVKEGTTRAETVQYDAVMRTEDRNRALAAFSEKKQPKFEGN